MKSGHIKCLAVARLPQRDVVASQVMIRTDNPEQFHAEIRDLLSKPELARLVAKAQYRVSGDVHAINIVMDADRIIYIAITSVFYSWQVASKLLVEMMNEFGKASFSTTAKTCSSGSLTAKTRPMFEKLTRTFDDPTKHDKVAKVYVEVDSVKKVMRKNIDKVLDNVDQLTKIEEDSERLRHSAGIFVQAATTVQRRECFRKWKTTAAIALSVVVVVTVIVLVAVL